MSVCASLVSWSKPGLAHIIRDGRSLSLGGFFEKFSADKHAPNITNAAHWNCEQRPEGQAKEEEPDFTRSCTYFVELRISEVATRRVLINVTVST